MYGVFQARVWGPTMEQQPPAPLADLMEKLGVAKPEQVSNLLVTAKRMFARNLRAVVAEYADDAADVDEEMARLREILSRYGA
jgi:hypothetical protein